MNYPPTFLLPEPDPLSLDERAWLAAEEAGDLAEAGRLAMRINTVDLAREKRLTDPTALLNAALWYATQGVPVFPLQPGTKVPFRGSRGFKDASTDRAQIHRWWSRHPQANIGTPTGILFDVIDVDGLQGLRTWWERGFQQETIGHVITPRGGGHHLYVPRSSHHNKARKMFGDDLPGLDFRGRGGYVVAPPSTLAEYGRQYRWLKPLEVQP